MHAVELIKRECCLVVKDRERAYTKGGMFLSNDYNNTTVVLLAIAIEYCCAVILIYHNCDVSRPTHHSLIALDYVASALLQTSC
jgi:hypothetical protein